MPDAIRRTEVVGLPISMTTYEQTIEMLHHPPVDRALTVAVCNVHSVMSARRDSALRDAIADADVATPDGQPVVWAVRALSRTPQPRVYGPELMRRAAGHGGLRHYLYGSTDNTLRLLADRLRVEHPGIEIAGVHAPPFRPMSDAELDEDAARIRASGANVVWVGLGMPKQELWMRQMRERLPATSIVGVGAAFDMIAGKVRQAPALIQRMGLEWLFRLVQEPRRLWRRYAWNNPAYVVLATRQIVTTRLSRSRRPDRIAGELTQPPNL